MSFELNNYIEPNFKSEQFKNSKECKLEKVKKDKVAPDDYHATSIFPEYFLIGGKWHLAKESRMDSVAVWDGKKILVKEFRNLKKGELVICGRSEDGSEGIYVHNNCFETEAAETENMFAFRTSHTRETSFSCDYKELSELLQ